MLSIEESQELMEKLLNLRQIAKDTGLPEDKKNYQNHEKLCLEKFKYIITMRTGRYKTFSNYEDLNQEGYEALLKGMSNYNPKKGNAFWWFHRYVGTRIARHANLHTTIRYPLKVAKANIPHKESVIPTIIEERFCPDKELEFSQITFAVKEALSKCSDEQQKILNLVYGFDGEKPISINKVCQNLNITRVNCIKTINQAFDTMKENIKI